MIAAARVIGASAEVELRLLSRNLFTLFSAIVQPFFIAVTVMYMLRGREDFAPVYVVVGAGLSGLWTVALFEGNWAVAGERWQGTLELLAAAPVPLILIIAGRMLGAMAFSLVAVVVSYIVGAWLFGYDVSVRDPVGFSVSLLLAIAALWAIGLLIAPVNVMWRTAGRFFNILEYPVYILAGFMFPILLLPGWLVPASYALPPYWAAVALHGTSAGDLGGLSLILVWSLLAVMTVGVVVIATRLYEALLRRARIAGSLALS